MKEAFCGMCIVNGFCYLTVLYTNRLVLSFLPILFRKKNDLINL